MRLNQRRAPWIIYIVLGWITVTLWGCDASLLVGTALDGGSSVSDQGVVDSALPGDAAFVADVSTPDSLADGSLDVPGPTEDGGTNPCVSKCHGSTANLAPPKSVTGETSTSVNGVGAHQQHLVTSTWHSSVQCTDCHLIPATVTSEGHIDTALPAELTFSTFSKTDGAQPAWDGTTCSGTYCHGSTLSGGAFTAPQWTMVDGSQVQCDGCHGMPPAGGHSSSTSCVTCHPAVVDVSQNIIAPALHIDGNVSATGSHPTGYDQGDVHGPDFFQDTTGCSACHGPDLTGGTGPSCESCHSGWKTNCTFCHGGTDNNTGAPPVSVDDQTATTVPGVGRHTSHVSAGASHVAYDCSLCHQSYTDALIPGHIDASPGEVSFSGAASGASYNHSTHMCTNLYCHGNGKPGNSGSAPWVGSLSGGCSACHDDETNGGNMTLSSRHKKHIVDENMACSDCHDCVVNSSKQIMDPSQHVDGKIDVCESTWNPSNKSCSPSGCHGSESW